MADFPTIAHPALLAGFTDEVAFDPTIKNNVTGYKLTAPAFTRLPRKWTVSYKLTESERTSMDTFEDDQGVGSGNFNWTHPQTSTVYDVRFTAPIQYSLTLDQSYPWTATMTIEEV